MRVTRNMITGLILALATVATALPNPDTVDQPGESRHAAHAPAGAELEDRQVEVPDIKPDPVRHDLFKAKHGFDPLVNAQSFPYKMASDRRSIDEEDGAHDDEGALDSE